MTEGGTMLIGVDVMGGDKAPDLLAAGALQGIAKLVKAGYEVEPVFFGNQSLMGDTGGFRVVSTPNVIEQRDDPLVAYMRKKDASMALAVNALAEGDISAMVSAGNTGALMTLLYLGVGTIEGIDRPGLFVPIPVPDSTPTIMGDVGALKELRTPEDLVQMAQMGAIFAALLGISDDPGVALWSMGTEDKKGPPHIVAANKLLREGIVRLPVGHFVGNREVAMSEEQDVLITDGPVGNGILKNSENQAAVTMDAAMKAEAGVEGGQAALKPLQAILDVDEYGGGTMLGLNKVGIKAHGRSGSRAIDGAVRVAHRLVHEDLVGRFANLYQA